MEQPLPNSISEKQTINNTAASSTDNELLQFKMSRGQRIIKRSFDFFFALFALIIASPVILVLTIVLLIGGNGRVFYRQERLGLHGKPFHIIKFRSMKVTAESDGPRLEVPNDDRLTRIGRFLRHHHLDELPQLWNVLKGDMSVVGPRPERRYFVEKIMERDPRYKYLFQVRPGLTSVATVDNGYTNTMEKMLRRLELDLQYLSKASVAFDIKLICRTVALMVHGD